MLLILTLQPCAPAVIHQKILVFIQPGFIDCKAYLSNSPENSTNKQCTRPVLLVGTRAALHIPCQCCRHRNVAGTRTPHTTCHTQQRTTCRIPSSSTYPCCAVSAPATPTIDKHAAHQHMPERQHDICDNSCASLPDFQCVLFVKE